MRAELAPPLGGAIPQPLSARHVAACLGVALAVAIAFWSPLLFGGALQGGDWSTHHFHYFDWIRTSLVDYGVLPLFMVDAWVTPNFLANAESPSLSPFVGLLWVLPTGAYVKLLIVSFTALGLAGVWLLLRDLDVAPPLAALAALVWAGNGFFVSHVTIGHHWAMGCWSLPALLWLARRAVLGSDGALVAAALLDAVAILGGQHQAFIWQNIVLALFAGFWTLRARSPLPIVRCGLVILAAIGLAAVKLLPLWHEFRGYAPQARIQGIPLGSLGRALLASGQGPEVVDPRIAYEHGAGWWEYAFYVGPLALAALLAGCVGGARRAWPLVGVGIFFFAISLEPSAVWGWIDDLPVWRTQRNPARFLLVAIFAGSIVGALGLEPLRRRAALRWPRGAALAAWAIVSVVAVDLYVESLAWQRAAIGPAIESRDHVPLPRRAGGDLAWLELREFSPNRLAYRVETLRAARLVIPVRYGKSEAEWDADPHQVFRHTDGYVAIEVPAGSRDVVLRYRPPYFRVGLLTSLGSLAAVLGWLLWRRRSGR